MSIISFVRLAALVFALLQCVSVDAKSKVEILDRDIIGSREIELVARSVCLNASNEAQIGRVSTINRLRVFFDQLGEAHPLKQCKELLGESIRELEELTSVSNSNVCSDEKISLIEKYHAKYVSTNELDKQKRLEKKTWMAPTTLRLFFMHYAMEVDAICKRNLINNLEWDLKEQFGDHQELQQIDGEVFSQVREKFARMYEVDNFDDVILFWPLIDTYVDASELAGHENRLPILVEQDEKTGEPIRLMIKVKVAKPMRDLQAKCRRKYKPIYSKLILPIIRLADLGYSNTGEQFRVELQELRNNLMVKHWYGITQLCEAIIPARFYEDSSMAENQIVMITKQEADLLEVERADDSLQEPLTYEPSTNSLEGVDLIESVDTDEAQTLVARVDTRLVAKNRIARRAMAQMFRHTKQQLKERLKSVKLLFSKPKSKNITSAERYEPTDIGTPLRISLDETSEEDINLMDVDLTVNKRPIERQRFRRRKGDVDMIKEMRAKQLSYRRTKTWGEIFDGWMTLLSQLAPTRIQMVAVGCIVGFIMMVTLFMLPITLAG